MKRMIYISLMILLTIMLSACGDKSYAVDASNSSVPRDIVDATQEDPSSKEWSEQDILALFEPKAESNWTVIDCARTLDFAFDRIGVILFVDNDNGYARLAFMNADGSYALVGIDAQPSVPTDLEYCENGIVTLQVKSKDGLEHKCIITFSQSEDGKETNFIIEDNL